MPGPSPEFDEQMMRRAIRLAMNGRGRVEPNPMVGCVIVNRDGRVIGEGYHEQFGGRHAEANALAACTESPAGATAYVTLEPCCHTNKKTPPCVPALISAKVARVVTGSMDPNPQVNGKGLVALREAGIAVEGPVLHQSARQLLAPFLKRVRENKPYVTLKWAESSDGRIAGPGGARQQISNAVSWRLVHALRTRSDAVLVGINTVLTDDPTLTVRHVEPIRRPTRVVLDRALRIPFDRRLIATVGEAPVFVGTTTRAIREQSEKVRELERRGVEVGYGWENLAFGLYRLSLGGVTHLMVEPGPTLAASFFAEGVVDRAWRFRSPVPVGQATAPAAAPIPSNLIETGSLDLAGDTLTEYLNPASPVFFAPEPSAEFVLARETHHAAGGAGGGG